MNTYTNLVQATLDGQGFALIGTPLLETFFASGKLVQPVQVSADPAPVILPGDPGHPKTHDGRRSIHGLDPQGLRPAGLKAAVILRPCRHWRAGSGR